MSYAKRKLDRVLAMLLSFMMVFSIMPANPVYAMSDTKSVLETNMENIDFIINESAEFTVTSTANEDAGAMVKGSFEFSDPSAIEKLEYYETTAGYEGWYELSGEFGPASGFELKDATSKFRVTFNKAGDYTVDIALKDLNTKEIICDAHADITVNPNACKLVTDISDKNLLVNEPTEFTVTSTANGVNAVVKGSFEFSDPSAIEKLEYYETTAGYEGWYELSGEFGPESGFELKDATSKFRVTFNKAGDYTVDIALKDVNTKEIVCDTHADITVERNTCQIITDISNKNFVAYEATEFSFTSIANDDAGKMVKGYFDFSDESAIEKLEYYETAEGMQGWYELKTHEFGPESGFPIVDNATSKFRVTFKKGGDFTVKVSLKQVSDQTELTYVESNVHVVNAEIKDVTVEATNNIYDGSEFALVNITGLQEGDIVTYKVNDEEVADPKATNAGNYTVIVTIDRGEGYDKFVKEVSSKIELADLELGEIKVQGLEGVYTGEAQDAVSVTGKGDYDLQYKLDDGEWSDTIPTVTDAGSYTVQVKATKTNYNDKEVDVDKAESAIYPFNVYVAKAKQEDFGFTNKNPEPLEYQSSIVYKAEGGQPNCTITYEVVEGAEYVSVDQEGKITALQAGGTAKIKATIAENSNYLAASDEYEIRTIKAPQTKFAFEKSEYIVYYGAEELTVVAKGGKSEGNITYEVVEGTLGTIESVDNKGNITFVSGQKGVMTIKATLEGGKNFKDITATAIVKVLSNDFKDKVSVVECPNTGWYTDTVMITPADGYKISTSDDFDTAWKNEIEVVTEGENIIGNVYLMHEESGDRYISDAIAIKDICIDKTNPTDLGIDYSRSIIDTLFGDFLKEIFSFYDAEMTVTLTATDMVSKIDHFVYQIGDGETVTIDKENIKFSGEDGINAEASFVIPANLNESKITMWAYDTAGRSTELIGDKNLIVDDVDPVISVSYDNNDAKNDFYFKKFDESKPTRTATITIKEENFFKDYLYEKVYKNDENGEPVEQEYNYLMIKVGKRLNDEVDYTYTDYEPEFEFDQENNVYKAEIEFIDDGDYTLDIKFFDFSLNENAPIDYGTSKAPTAFTIDNTAPIVEISYVLDKEILPFTNDGYYKGTPELKISVNEHNFNVKDLDFDVFKALDVTTEIDNKEEVEKIIAHFMNPTNWSDAEDMHIAEYPITVDANYSITLNYNDLADNAADEEKSACTLDNMKPYVVADAEISYSASIIDTILNAITFGFYNAEMEVTITAYDDTAGIDFFTYSYIVDYSNDKDGHEDEVGHKDDKGKKDVEIPHSEITFTEGDKKATATFKIPEQFRGYVSFTATDKSNNTSEEFKDDKCIVVDSATPVVNVTYDNNEVQNGNYYKEDRTATITISADNFFKDYLYCPIDNIDGNEDYLVITVGTRLDNEIEYTYENVKPAFIKDGDVYKATVDFDKNADYKFDIKYTDKSHNVYDSYVEDEFTVDKNPPALEVVFSEPAYSNVNQYREDRTATIIITEHNFDAKDVETTVVGKDAFDVIQPISFKDENGNVVTDYAAYLSDNGNWTSSGDEHKAVITFSTEVDFAFDIKYTDLAGNEWDSFDEVEFTVDKTAPTASVQIGTWTESIDGTVWNAFPEGEKDTRAFGSLSTNEKVTVTINTNDTLSGVDYVKHFRSDKILILKEVQTSNEWITVTENTDTITYDVEPNEKFVVYVCVVDMAGNEHYVSSDGIILDKSLPTVEKVAPEITIGSETDKQPINDIYNTDVDVDVMVVDSTENGTYSGLKSIIYNIYNVNAAGVETKTQDGVLYTFDKTSGEKIESIYDETACIKVDRTKNNSNNVIIEVIATDNAGNIKTERQTIKIDITAPVIDIAYDNNEVDSATYFDAIRKATIKISERNFKNEDVIITVIHTDDEGKETKRTITPNFTVEMDGNTPKVYTFDSEGRDGSEYYVYTMDYIYDKDGDYKFEIEYSDLASNKCTEKNFAEDTAAGTEYEFTLDMTKPVIKVTYDNNNVLNGNYYKAGRIATIVITEHNLDPNGADKGRINITVTATDDGAVITAPVETQWATNGNTHTATITYSADGLYNFDISVKDKAGNESADYVAETFYVDKTAPTLDITGVADLSANNGDVIPVVTYSDTNYDADRVTITLTGANRNGVALDGSYSDIHNGRVFTFANFAKEQAIDDIYTLTAKLTDKAGNTTEKTITFSVNRFGSTYALSEEAEKLNGSYVKEPVDVVITETNADELSNIKVTLFKDGETIVLKENTDYKIDLEGGNGQWYHYTYTIFAKNFEADGVYSLTVESDDKAGNEAKNDQDTKDTAINFGVDSTLPIINIENLESETTYALDNMTVTMNVKDNLKLTKVIVELDGKEYKTWTAEELEEIIKNGGNFTFDISGDSTDAHNLVVYAVDAAGNGEKISDTDLPANTESIKKFYVTTNLWVRYYTNKPLFYGSIAGVIVLAGFIVFLIYKKKKDEEEK